MTKSETISNLKAYLDGDTAIGNIIPLRSVLESAIKYLEPSLPSNLDEAAINYAYDGEPEKYGIEFAESNGNNLRGDKADAFKAGAEWMAGQGVVKEAVIGMATEEISINVSEQTLNELDLCPGDKVVVQIRKK